MAEKGQKCFFSLTKLLPLMLKNGGENQKVPDGFVFSPRWFCVFSLMVLYFLPDDFVFSPRWFCIFFPMVL